jgi:2-polyprenyl-3-methyl-5-hydroxy-6-metoxy-1,4-benzoquinol methylase
MSEFKKEALIHIYHDLLARSRKDKSLEDHVKSLQDILGVEPPKPFEELQGLLNTKQWPNAVNPNLICDRANEEDKVNRAEGILEVLVERDVVNKKFLDFGCGEGHVAQCAIRRKAVLSVGYDIKAFDNWKANADPKLKFTTDLSEVEKNGPFDIILVYDVLDHIESGKQIEILQKLRNFLNPTGEIYVRFHPWCSRHATHAYHAINKAYVHLVFSAEELSQLGLTNEPNAKVVMPVATYRNWIEQSGLKIKHESVMREKIEPFFFEQPEIKQRIVSHWKGLEDKLGRSKGFPSFQIEQQFLDFILSR